MMRVRIVNITDRGVAYQERLHLSVWAPSNLVNYAVFVSRKIAPTTIKTPPDYAYWFMNTPVYPGDQIVLYTGTGQNTSEQRQDGRWNRFFYWGLSHTVWHDPQSCAVLLEINEWDTKP